MGKLKIPSEKLVITGNHIYKGYYAEYRSRLRQGEFLIVHLGCNGHEAAIPIGNIIFIMNDGRLLKYIPINVNGLSLVEVGKEDQGEVVTLIEDVGSPSNNKKPLFLLDEESIEEMNEDIDEGDISEQIQLENTSELAEQTNDKRRRSSTEYADTYKNIYKKTRDNVELNPHPVTDMLGIFFSLIGMQMDNVAINNHSVILQNYLKNQAFSHIIFNTYLYKMFVLAYIFIYINNLGIGYSVIYPGCRISPNDDPTYIICVAYKSKFLDALVKIDEQIADLLNVMGTKIVPSDTTIGISNRFSYLRVVKNKLKPAITRKTKFMRLPLTNTTKISNIVNKTILDKAKASGINMNSVDFQSYISGSKYRSLLDNPESVETKAILPFVEEYKKRMEFETDKFYIANIQIKNTVKAAIINKIKASKTTNKYVLDLAQDLDKYLYDLTYQKLVKNPNSVESKSVLPYINEYKKLIDIETEKFYKDASKATIKNAKMSDNTIDNSISERALELLNSELIKKGETLTGQERTALQYTLDNCRNIIKLSASDIKDIEISIISASPEQKIHLYAVLSYHNKFMKYLNKLTYKRNDKTMRASAKKYRENIQSIKQKTAQDLSNLKQMRQKRASIDKNKMDIVN